MMTNYKAAAIINSIALIVMTYFAIVGNIGTTSPVVKIVYMVIALIFAMLLCISVNKILNEKLK